MRTAENSRNILLVFTVLLVDSNVSILGESEHTDDRSDHFNPYKR